MALEIYFVLSKHLVDRNELMLGASVDFIGFLYEFLMIEIFILVNSLIGHRVFIHFYRWAYSIGNLLGRIGHPSYLVLRCFGAQTIESLFAMMALGGFVVRSRSHLIPRFKFTNYIYYLTSNEIRYNLVKFCFYQN